MRNIILCVAFAAAAAFATCTDSLYMASYIYEPGEFEQAYQSSADDAALAEIRPLSDDTIYLYLPNISPRVRRFVIENRGYLARFDRLILDLRGNYGGQLAEAYVIADIFLENGDIIGHESGRFSFLNREIKARGVREISFESIVIMQNAQTASAAESLILALSANLDNVTLVGETSYGKATAQIVLPLKDGFSMNASVLSLRGPNGENINEVGIKPDIEYSGKSMLEFVTALRGGY